MFCHVMATIYCHVDIRDISDFQDIRLPRHETFANRKAIEPYVTTASAFCEASGFRIILSTLKDVCYVASEA